MKIGSAKSLLESPVSTVQGQLWVQNVSLIFWRLERCNCVEIYIFAVTQCFKEWGAIWGLYFKNRCLPLCSKPRAGIQFMNRHG